MSTEQIVDARFRDHTEFHLGDSTGRVTFNKGGDYWIGRVDGVWLLNSSSRLLAEKEVRAELTRQVRAKPSVKAWIIRFKRDDTVMAHVFGIASAREIVRLINQAEGMEYVYRSAEKEEV